MAISHMGVAIEIILKKQQRANQYSFINFNKRIYHFQSFHHYLLPNRPFLCLGFITPHSKTANGYYFKKNGCLFGQIYTIILPSDPQTSPFYFWRPYLCHSVLISVLLLLFGINLCGLGVCLQQQQNIVVVDRMQALRSSSKKLYQLILSSKQPSQLLRDSLSCLLRRTVESSEHLDFLLHRVNWFQPPFTHYHHLFLKILRIYGSKSKQSSKVIYNLLIESFINPHSARTAHLCLAQLFTESYDKRTIILCLKENYPHKLCSLESHMLYLTNMLQLCTQFRDYRMDFLEIIIENFVNFDTELVLADEWVHRPFPEDEKIIALREQAHQNELSQKFDLLLHHLLDYLSSLDDDCKIIGELLLVFQNKVLPIKTTKLIQFVIFNIAESSKARANTFISFLLGNIFDPNHKENFYRIFTQSNFYLFSYILRSKRLTPSTVSKTLKMMMERLTQKLQNVEEVQINERANLKEIYHQNQMLLMILQTIMIININHESRDLDLTDKYRRLVEQSSKKLHFEYFLREEILEKINIDKKDNKTNVTVKFSNKFLPATLPNVGRLIDPKMRLSQSLERGRFCEQVRALQPMCRKLNKGQTPVSYCSQTVIV